MNDINLYLHNFVLRSLNNPLKIKQEDIDYILSNKEYSRRLFYYLDRHEKWNFFSYFNLRRFTPDDLYKVVQNHPARQLAGLIRIRLNELHPYTKWDVVHEDKTSGLATPDVFMNEKIPAYYWQVSYKNGIPDITVIPVD